LLFEIIIFCYFNLFLREILRKKVLTQMGSVVEQLNLLETVEFLQLNNVNTSELKTMKYNFELL